MSAAGQGYRFRHDSRGVTRRKQVAFASLNMFGGCCGVEGINSTVAMVQNTMV